MSATPFESGARSKDAIAAPENGLNEQDSKTLTDAISAAALFHDLQQPVIRAIVDIAALRTYGAGEPVFTLGQYDGNDFFFVISGRLKMTFIDSRSGAMHMDEVAPGSIFGLDVSFAAGRVDSLHHLTLTAESRTELAVFDAEAFRMIAAQRPSLTRNVMLYFAAELSKTRFQALEKNSVPEKRVFAALMTFVERDPITGNWRIARMPKHRELADKANVDETIAAGAVAQLIQERIAQRDYPGLIINDVDALNRLAN